MLLGSGFFDKKVTSRIGIYASFRYDSKFSAALCPLRQNFVFSVVKSLTISQDFLTT